MKKQAKNQNIYFSLLSILRGSLSHQLRKKILNNLVLSLSTFPPWPTALPMPNVWIIWPSKLILSWNNFPFWWFAHPPQHHTFHLQSTPPPRVFVTHTWNLKFPDLMGLTPLVGSSKFPNFFITTIHQNRNAFR